LADGAAMSKIAKDDRMIVPETQRYMAERMRAKIKAHAVDHAPWILRRLLMSNEKN